MLQHGNSKKKIPPDTTTLCAPRAPRLLAAAASSLAAPPSALRATVPSGGSQPHLLATLRSPVPTSPGAGCPCVPRDGAGQRDVRSDTGEEIA